MTARRIRLDWRRVVLLVLLLLLTLWVVTRFAALRDLAAILLHAQWQWLVAATVLHLLYLVINGMLYQASFSAVEVRTTLRQVLPVMFAVYFINVVAPSGGVAGAALFVDSAMRWGQSGARAAVGTVLTLLVDLATLIPFIVYSLVYLSGRGQLRVYQTLTAAFFCAFIVILTAALVLARQRPALLTRLLAWLQRLVNGVGARFKRPELLPSNWAGRNARELQEGSAAIAAHPDKLAVAAAWAVLMHLLDLASLYVLFPAFEQAVPLGTVVAGFSMGIIFWVVTIVPSGLATVEAIMALVFTSLGVPAAPAAAVVLAFRGLNFWLPLFIGFFLLRYVPMFQVPHSPGGGSEAAVQPRI
jgi:uncharacterized protein (TIRG00374 family)